jgi:hypothetical protein
VNLYAALRLVCTRLACLLLGRRGLSVVHSGTDAVGLRRLCDHAGERGRAHQGHGGQESEA